MRTKSEIRRPKAEISPKSEGRNRAARTSRAESDQGESHFGFRSSDFGLRISSPFLIIGYGNTLRSDDGVGPKVAEAVALLELPRIEALACDLLTPELAEPISRAGAVIFVDAAVDPPREVQLRPLAPAESSQIMAHAADPRTILALARDVFGHAPKAWCLTIPAENLSIGEEFSHLAQRGVARAIEEIRALAANKLPLCSVSHHPDLPKT